MVEFLYSTGLRHARHVRRRRTAGSPTGREPYGDGVPVVVAGATTCQGGRESRPQGEGAQVIKGPAMGGMRNAERRNGAGRPPPGYRAHPEMITGEQGAGKLASPVREEADGKGPKPRAPRRRPTSLGGAGRGNGPPERAAPRPGPTLHAVVAELLAAAAGALGPGRRAILRVGAAGLRAGLLQPALGAWCLLGNPTLSDNQHAV